MNYTEFSKKVKEKFPQYSDMSDEELTRKMLVKFPTEYSDIDTTNMGSKPVQPVTQKPQEMGVVETALRSAFPRLTENTSGELTPKEVGKDVLRGSLDALSFLPRYAASETQGLAQTLGNLVRNGNLSDLKNVPSRFLQDLKITETPTGTGALGLVEDVARGPFLYLPGAGQVGTGVIGAASKLPLGAGAKIASVAPRLMEGVVPKIAAGVGDIAMGAGMGTAESVAKNEGINPLGVGIGGALGALNPLGRAIKSGADNISDVSVGREVIRTMQEQLLNGNNEEQKAAKIFLEKYGTPKDASEYMNKMIEKFTGDSKQETINQGIKKAVKWVDPATPGPMSNEPIVRSWTHPTPAPLTTTDLILSTLPGIGTLYAGGKYLINHPHFASDVTSIVPKQTGTSIRNLGIGIVGPQSSEK